MKRIQGLAAVLAVAALAGGGAVAAASVGGSGPGSTTTGTTTHTGGTGTTPAQRPHPGVRGLRGSGSASPAAWTASTPRRRRR